MHWNKGCLQRWKKGLDIKNTPDYIQYADVQIRIKFLFMKKFQTWPHFSKTLDFFSCFFFFRYIVLGTLIPLILFSETLLATPILFQDKKSHELKTKDFISSDILSQDFRKYRLFTNIFSCDFLTQIPEIRTCIETEPTLNPPYTKNEVQTFLNEVMGFTKYTLPRSKGKYIHQKNPKNLVLLPPPKKNLVLLERN